MKIIDTHLHLVYRDRFSYPWLEGVPPLNRDFPIGEYRPEAQAAGISGMIHMEVDVAEHDQFAETEFVSSLDPGIIGVISSCRPESRDFPAQLETFARMKSVRGLRRILHTSPDEISQSLLFAENLRRLAQYRMSFDLCVLARQIPFAARLAEACPDVQFILDHCGIPNVKERELDPWRNYIREIASFRNVACKVSGVIAYADPKSWTVDDLRPFVEHVIASFGWDRVVWGSDWPVCMLAAGLSDWVAATHSIIAGASDDEKARLLSRNAERIYRLS